MSHIKNPLSILPNKTSDCGRFYAKFQNCFGLRGNVFFCICNKMENFCLKNEKDYLKSSIDCSKMKEPVNPILVLPDNAVECLLEFEVMQFCFGWELNKRECYCSGFEEYCSPEEYDTFKNKIKSKFKDFQRGTTRGRFYAWKTANIITICFFSFNLIFGISGKKEFSLKSRYINV